jgi:hypothetical protein
MAEPEVEAAWRAEFERSGAKKLRDALDGDGFTNELKRQAAFRWLGDEAEVQRLQQDQTYHYVRCTTCARFLQNGQNLRPMGGVGESTGPSSSL